MYYKYEEIISEDGDKSNYAMMGVPDGEYKERSPCWIDDGKLIRVKFSSRIDKIVVDTITDFDDLKRIDLFGIHQKEILGKIFSNNPRLEDIRIND